MSSILNIGNNIYQIDVFDHGKPEKTSSYLILADRVTIIETGATPAKHYLKSALAELGIPPERVEYIIVTHIHLDHSGGAGALLRDLPNARVLVHPRGAKHLSDPSRIIAGARMVYENCMPDYFVDVVPVPTVRIDTMEDGASLDLGGGRELFFYHTLGHARHHLVIHDPASQGVFSGDTLGVCLPALSRRVGFPYTMPTTPPSEFDPPALINTLDRVLDLQVRNIYFTHFGVGTDAPAIIRRIRELAMNWTSAGQRIFTEGGGAEELEEALWDSLILELASYGLRRQDLLSNELLCQNIKVSAMGILHYFSNCTPAALI